MQHRLPKITIEQWAAFKAVVDEGSHAAAADRLNKSPSTISYLLARLNQQLPSPALELQGRKATLTRLGKTLYRHASHLLDQALACEDAAAYLASGWESELRIACDALIPLQPVMCALQSYSLFSPLTRIRILESSLSGTDEAILQGECDLALTPHVPPGFLAVPLGTVMLLAVAHRDHPLAQMASISEAELKTHRQIVMRDTGRKREQDAGWLGAAERWTVSHFATSVEMVAAGLGFAFLPEHRVKPLLLQGVLRALPLMIGSSRLIPLSLVIPQAHPGPGSLLLKDKIQTAFAHPEPGAMP